MSIRSSVAKIIFDAQENARAARASEAVEMASASRIRRQIDALLGLRT